MVKPIDAYVRTDANALREYLRGRGLSSESIGRNLTSIRAIVNFVSKEEGLQPVLSDKLDGFAVDPYFW